MIKALERAIVELWQAGAPPDEEIKELAETPALEYAEVRVKLRVALSTLVEDSQAFILINSVLTDLEDEV